MKTYKLYQVDAFTKERFGGNGAGVITNADGLTDEQMQKIARELNNSESAFMFSSNSPDYDVEVRFFTPKNEAPLCSHATVAAQVAYAIEHQTVGGRVIQKTGAGVLPMDVTVKDGNYSVVMTQGEPVVGEPLPNEVCAQIADALGIEEKDFIEGMPIAIASTGYGKVMVPIKSNELLHSLKPNEEHLIELSRQLGPNGFYVFTLNPGEEILVHGRMFAPISGVSEDPVTGNANGPLGAYLVHYNILQDPESKSFDFDIRQGEAIGRAGGMHVHVEKEGNVPKLVQITGDAVIVYETEITL